MKNIENKEKIEILKVEEELNKKEKEELKEKMENLIKSFDDFLEANSKMVISFIPFLLLLNYSSNLEYWVSYPWTWTALIIILIWISITYSINTMIKINNIVMRTISILLLIFIAVLYLFIWWDVAKNNICKNSDISRNSEVYNNCQKIKTDLINRKQ